jgi:predicted DNA binding CopG/RHH family protein
LVGKLALRLMKRGSVWSVLQSQASLFQWSLPFEMEESDQLARVSQAERKGGYMKKSAKRLKAYDKIEFDSKEIIEGMSRLKGARRKPTSIALEEELLKELKAIASKRGVPYQVLMRLLIAEGVKRLKEVA